MAKTIMMPMFPLGVVAFPTEKLNLHIFEPRYLQMIKECEAFGLHFGLPAFIDKKLMMIGTEMELVAIEKVYPNGEMDIKTKGVGLFKIHEFFPKMEEKLYGGAAVNPVEFDVEGDFLAYQKILEGMAELFKVLHINKPLPTIDENFTTYSIAHHIGLTVEQEFELLKITREEDRQEYIVEHLDRLIPLVREMHRLQERARLNGHFKHLQPPDLEI
jgi:ATP-dependent Lon protease